MQLTVSDAARLLDTTPERVYEWIDEGAIPFYRVSDQYRFHRAEILEWATARGMPVSVELFQNGDEADEKPLLDAILAGGIHRDLPGDDRAAVIRAILDRLPIPEPAERELIHQILVARDAVRSSIGDGIAIPHVRNPIVLHGSKSAIAISFLAHPIDYDAIDGKPVHTIFMMVTPTPKAHLFLLSRLSTALCDAGFKDAIVRRAPDREILDQADRVEASFAKKT
jgi:PTS system nitrogen regulatory IIA component